MLKNIEIREDKTIIVANPKALIKEANDRLSTPGIGSYMERFIRDKTRLRRRKGWYPEEKRVEVATLFASGVTTSSDLERLTGVKATVIRDWRTSDWWPELMERIHTAHDEDTVSKFTKIIDRSLEIVQDRLNHGDFIMKKDGTLARKPVSLRDATVAGAIVVDKRQLLRGKPTSRSEIVSVGSRLEKLAAEFKKFVTSTEIQGEVVKE